GSAVSYVYLICVLSVNNHLFDENPLVAVIKKACNTNDITGLIRDLYPKPMKLHPTRQ
ncbi:MAG: hypothetical protein ACJAUL_002711, partial [Paraglaciecola sp.]